MAVAAAMAAMAHSYRVRFGADWANAAAVAKSGKLIERAARGCAAGAAHIDAEHLRVADLASARQQRSSGCFDECKSILHDGA